MSVKCYKETYLNVITG